MIEPASQPPPWVGAAVDPLAPEPPSDWDWAELAEPIPGAVSEAEARALEDLPPAEGAPPAREPWRIRSTGAADWAMAMLRDASVVLTDAAERRDAAIRRARDWHDRTTREAQRSVNYFTGQLEAWAIAEREANPKRKTFPVLGGKVATTEVKARPEVVDEAAVLAWAEAFAPEAVERKPKLHRSKLPAVVTILLQCPSCEVIDGGWDASSVDVDEDRHACAACGALHHYHEVRQIDTVAVLVTDADGEHPGATIPGMAVAPWHLTARVVVDPDGLP